jgi:Icc-related predicted phosphoesterase
MRILAIGDPHGKLPKNLDGIIKKNKIDVIICSGDIAPAPIIPKKGETFEQACKRAERIFKKIIDKLCSYNLPFLTLRGNVFTSTKEGNNITHKIFFPHKNLYHKKTGKITVKGITFIFFDFLSEKESTRTKRSITPEKRRNNKNREIKLNKLLEENPDSVLIAHNPPLGILDKIHSGKHVGSKILFRAIKKHKPKLVLCGHIHEGKGKKKLGKTTIYNLGEKGEYGVIDIK